MLNVCREKMFIVHLFLNIRFWKYLPPNSAHYLIMLSYPVAISKKIFKNAHFVIGGLSELPMWLTGCFWSIHVWRLFTCGGNIHVWNVHVNSCVECAGSIHMWRFLMCGEDIPCGTYMWIHVWNVQGLFLCGPPYMLRAHEFMCGTYTWIHMWNMQGLFTCGGSSCVRRHSMWNIHVISHVECAGSIHVWRLLTCGGDIDMLNIHINLHVECAGFIHMWRLLTCGGDIHMWNVHVNSRVEHAGPIYVWRLSRV